MHNGRKVIGKNLKKNQFSLFAISFMALYFLEVSQSFLGVIIEFLFLTFNIFINRRMSTSTQLPYTFLLPTPPYYEITHLNFQSTSSKCCHKRTKYQPGAFPQKDEFKIADPEIQRLQTHSMACRLDPMQQWGTQRGQLLCKLCSLNHFYRLEGNLSVYHYFPRE